MVRESVNRMQSQESKDVKKPSYPLPCISFITILILGELCTSSWFEQLTPLTNITTREKDQQGHK